MFPLELFFDSPLRKLLPVLLHKRFSLAMIVNFSLEMKPNIPEFWRKGMNSLPDEVLRSVAGVEDLSETWMHHYVAIFGLAINISACTVLVQGRSVEQHRMFVQNKFT